MKQRMIYLILCLGILLSIPGQALADNWVKTEAKGNVWVDTSHYENKPKWIDTSYWSTKRVLVPSGYWQTNQTLVSAGYWQTQNILVTPGKWKVDLVLVKDGYYDTKKVLVDKGHWTYKEVLVRKGHYETRTKKVTEKETEYYWTAWDYGNVWYEGGWNGPVYDYARKDPWPGDWGGIISYTEIWPGKYDNPTLAGSIETSRDGNTQYATFNYGWQKKRLWCKEYRLRGPNWGWSNYYHYMKGLSNAKRYRKSRVVTKTKTIEYQVWIDPEYKRETDKWIPDQYKTTQVWVDPVYRTDKVWVDPVYKTTSVWIPPVYNTTKTWIDTSTYQDVPVYINSGYMGTEQVWVTSGFNFNPQGIVSISKTPTYVFTQKAKLQDGSPAYMDLTVNWSGMNQDVSEVKAYHDLIRYKNRGTVRVDGVQLSADLNNTQGQATFRFTYPYAALPTSKLYVEIVLKNGAVVRTNAEIPVNSFVGTYNENAPDPVWNKSEADSGSISF